LGFSLILPSFCTLMFAGHSIPHHPPNVSIPDTTYLVYLTSQIFNLICWDLVQAAASAREAFRHNEMVQVSFTCSQSFLVTYNVRYGMVCHKNEILLVLVIVIQSSYVDS